MSAISSLASVVKMAFGSEPVYATIVPLKDDGTQDDDYERGFQYFPETITSTRGANWVAKPVPGGSHPLYQFINGTDHAISFPAIFTADEKPFEASIGGVLDALSGGFSVSSAVGGMFGKVKKHTADVGAAVGWLRSFTYPDYKGKTGEAKPPPVLRLYLPNSGINGKVGNNVVKDSIDVIMTQCDVTYEAFYRSGHPRIVVVQLSFFETVQVGSNWGFVSRTAFDKGSNWASSYGRGKGKNAGLSSKSAESYAGLSDYASKKAAAVFG